MADVKEAPEPQVEAEATTQEEQTQKEPTPEEIKAHKKELLKFYTEELPLLKKQAEFEELHTRIDVAKMTRLEIMIARAQIMQGPQGQEGQEGEEGQPKKERSLKQD